MAEKVISANWKALNDKELPICRFFNRLIQNRFVRYVFCLATRLGNGLIWYAFFAILPLVDPLKGWRVSLLMLVSGAVGYGLYKLMKHLTHRARPYINHSQLISPVKPLDFYSFPSGHTLHAFSLSTILSFFYPGISYLLWLFSSIVAASRVALAHHYLSDVLAGGGIGLIVGYTVLNFAM